MLIDKLKNTPIVLGSQSPRRKELLASMDIDFDVEVYPVEEKINSNLSPDAIAIDIALAKLTAFDKAEYASKLVITADTIVVAPNGQVIGKPRTEQDAMTMIKGLVRNTHFVITAAAMQYKGTVVSFAETTKVQFAHLSTDEIQYYTDRYRPYERAGADGIQEWIGRIGIDHLEGSFENVMGLPTQRLYRELKKLFDCPTI